MDFYLLRKIWVKILVKSGKYSRKPLDHAKKSAADALRTSSKRVIQKAAGDFIGNKIADRITKV